MHIVINVSNETNISNKPRLQFKVPYFCSGKQSKRPQFCMHKFIGVLEPVACHRLPMIRVQVHTEDSLQHQAAPDSL